MSYNDRIQELLSAIDRIIDERENVNKIEREIHLGEEDQSSVVKVFAVNAKGPVTAELMSEIDKTTTFARDEAQKLGFKTSRIRPARDHRGCRQFEID